MSVAVRKLINIHEGGLGGREGEREGEEREYEIERVGPYLLALLSNFRIRFHKFSLPPLFPL